MYTSLFNRLCGWLLIALGTIGLLAGGIGDYMQMSGLESDVFLGLGVLAVMGARSRFRYAFPTAFLLAAVLLAWGILGIAQPQTILGYAEPLDNAVRCLAGIWGLYTVFHDFVLWRREPST